MDQRNTKSPLGNSSSRRSNKNPFQRKKKSPNSPLLNDHLQKQISNILENPGRKKAKNRRRRNRIRRTYSQDEENTEFLMDPADSDIRSDISFSMPEPSFPRTMTINDRENSLPSQQSFPKPAKRAIPKIEARPIEIRHPSPPPSPSNSSVSSAQSITSSLYSTTSSNAPQRLLQRLEQKQKKYKALSAKLVECERDLFDSRSQLHDRIGNISDLKTIVARKDKKLAIQREELVGRCEELNTLKKELEKEVKASKAAREQYEQKEKVLKAKLSQSNQSHRKLLARTIENWESKLGMAMEMGQKKESQTEQMGLEVEHVKDELRVLRSKLDEYKDKLEQRNSDIGSKEGELVLLRQEKTELEKSVLCLSRHIEKERQMRKDLEQKSDILEKVSESERRKCEEIKRLETQLDQLRQLREKEVYMVRRTMDRITSCSEQMKENLPSALHRSNYRRKNFDEDWTAVTDRSNVFLGELKKKVEHYQSEDEAEEMPKSSDDGSYVNPFIQFCGSMYTVFRKFISKQQDVNLINSAYVDQMKRKEIAVNRYVSKTVMEGWRRRTRDFQNRQMTFCSRRM